MIELVVYGTNRSMPEGLQLAFSAKFASNPHHDKRLRQLTGLDAPVIREVQAAPKFNERIDAFVKRITETGVKRVGVFCTAGRHRSPVVAQAIAERLRTKGYPVQIKYLNPILAEKANVQKANV